MEEKSDKCIFGYTFLRERKYLQCEAQFFFQLLQPLLELLIELLIDLLLDLLSSFFY